MEIGDIDDIWADDAPRVEPLAITTSPVSDSSANLALAPLPSATFTRTLVRGDSDESRQPISEMAKASTTAAVQKSYKSCMTDGRRNDIHGGTRVRVVERSGSSHGIAPGSSGTANTEDWTNGIRGWKVHLDGTEERKHIKFGFKDLEVIET